MSSNLRADLIKKINDYGEEPPKHWKCAHLRARLVELKAEHGDLNSTPLKKLEKELSKMASQKKAVLQEYVMGKGLEITGNETKDQLVALVLRTYGAQIPGCSADSLGFGTHASMTYGEVKSSVPTYCAWVITTYQESGGQDGSSSWRLKRLAKWLMSEDSKASRPAEPKALVKPPKDRKGVLTFSSAEDSSGSMVKIPPTTTPPVPSDSEEDMPSDAEIKIAQLESQLRDLQRSRKGHRAK